MLSIACANAKTSHLAFVVRMHKVWTYMMTQTFRPLVQGHRLPAYFLDPDKKGSITLIKEIETYNSAEHEFYRAYKC